MEFTKLTQKCDKTFTSNTRRKSSGSPSRNELDGIKPALLTKISTIPISVLISFLTSSMRL